MSAALSIASRVAAALLGGYALCYAGSYALAAWLPVSNAHATYSVASLSFVIYVIAILWAFAARSARRAWLGMLLPALVAALLGVAHRGLR